MGFYSQSFLIHSRVVPGTEPRVSLRRYGGHIEEKGAAHANLSRDLDTKVPDGSTLSLAQVLHRPEAEIFTDLDKLLYHKFFKNAVLDRVNRQLVLTGLQCPQRQENAQILVETVTVTCSACGGVTEIPVQGKGKCQYCGFQLSALQTAKRV